MYPLSASLVRRPEHLAPNDAKGFSTAAKKPIIKNSRPNNAQNNSPPSNKSQPRANNRSPPQPSKAADNNRNKDATADNTRRDYKANYGTTNRRQFGGAMSRNTTFKQNEQIFSAGAPKIPTSLDPSTATSFSQSFPSPFKTTRSQPGKPTAVTMLHQPLSPMPDATPSASLESLVATMFQPLHDHYAAAVQTEVQSIPVFTQKLTRSINNSLSPTVDQCCIKAFETGSQLYSKLSQDAEALRLTRAGFQAMYSSMWGYRALHLQRILVGPDVKLVCDAATKKRLMDPERAWYFDIGIFPADIASRLYDRAEILEVSRETMEFRIITHNTGVSTEADYKESEVMTTRTYLSRHSLTPDSLQPELIRTGRMYRNAEDGLLRWGRGWRDRKVIIDEEKRRVAAAFDEKEEKNNRRKIIRRAKMKRKEILLAATSAATASKNAVEETAEPIVNEMSVRAAEEEDARHGDVLGSRTGKTSTNTQGSGGSKRGVSARGTANAGKGSGTPTVNHVSQGEQVLESLLQQTKQTATKSSAKQTTDTRAPARTHASQKQAQPNTTTKAIDNQGNAAETEMKTQEDVGRETKSVASPKVRGSTNVADENPDISCGGMGNDISGKSRSLLHSFREFLPFFFGKKMHTLSHSRVYSRYPRPQFPFSQSQSSPLSSPSSPSLTSMAYYDPMCTSMSATKDACITVPYSSHAFNTDTAFVSVQAPFLSQNPGKTNHSGIPVLNSECVGTSAATVRSLSDQHLRTLLYARKLLLRVRL